MPPRRFPPAVAKAIRHFNTGAYFEAHEAFEELLDEVEGDERWDLLVALIQVAVGYHKAASGYPGAERMLRLGAEKLAPFPTLVAGLDVEALRQRVAEDLALITEGDTLTDRLKNSPPRLGMRRDPAD